MITWPNECIEWDGYRHKTGYGQTAKIDGMQRYTHRQAWEVVHGPIANGLHVLHSCDNPPCFNVGHLRLGTHKDNMRDMRERKRCTPQTNRFDGSWKSKLSLDDVNEIRVAQLLGVAQTTLAKLFNVTTANIGRILAGQTWVSK